MLNWPKQIRQFSSKLPPIYDFVKNFIKDMLICAAVHSIVIKPQTFNPTETDYFGQWFTRLVDSRHVKSMQVRSLVSNVTDQPVIAYDKLIYLS